MSALTPRSALTDERDLKLLIQQMNRILRDSAGGGLMERFEAISKLLLTKIVDEREAAGTWPDTPKKEQPELAVPNGDVDRVLYERARAIWQRTVSAHPRVFRGARGRFPTDVHGVAKIVRLLSPISLSATPNDIKGGAYEEILRNTFEKNENQQFFTPRHVVDFIVEMCAPTDDLSVCDPAAGSGGFLVGVLTYVAHNGGDLRRLSTQMRGAEIDDRMAWVARINMLMHGGDATAVRHLTGAGSLAPVNRLEEDLPIASFDLILTNPPFGSDMSDAAALGALQTGHGRQSRRRGVLFLERCLDLLKPGGRVAIILDDSVLNLPGNADVRAILRDRAIVEAVVSLPDVTFMPYSTAKSSILVVRRRTKNLRQGAVLMADVENVGTRPNGDPLYGDDVDANGQRIVLSDLPRVLQLWKGFKAGQRADASWNETMVFHADIDEYQSEPDGDRLDVYYYHPLRRATDQRLRSSAYPLIPLNDVVEIDSTSVSPAEEFGDAVIRWIGLGDIAAGTGEYEVKELVGDRVKSNSHIFRPGDVLHSRLRPRLRKTVLIPPDSDGGVCSGELLVLRLKHGAENELAAEYLAYLLRTDLVFGQVIYRITGIGRPRVSADTIRRLLIPLPPLETQSSLIKWIKEAEGRAAGLRVEARRLENEAVRTIHDSIDRALDELVSSR